MYKEMKKKNQNVLSAIGRNFWWTLTRGTNVKYKKHLYYVTHLTFTIYYVIIIKYHLEL